MGATGNKARSGGQFQIANTIDEVQYLLHKLGYGMHYERIGTLYTRVMHRSLK